jgi:Bacterial regulatory protein, Fis family
VALAPDDSTITPAFLSERILSHRSLGMALPAAVSSLKQARLTFERVYVAEVLRQNQGNAVRTARVLGISRMMLQQMIKPYGLRARGTVSSPGDTGLSRSLVCQLQVTASLEPLSFFTSCLRAAF